MTFAKTIKGEWAIYLCNGNRWDDKKMSDFCKVKQGNCYVTCLFKEKTIPPYEKISSLRIKMQGGTFLLLKEEQLWNS